MINVNKLRAAWIAMGLTQGDVAKFIGISEKTMSTRMDKAVFGSDEIDILVEKLEISNPKEIFFPSW